MLRSVRVLPEILSLAVQIESGASRSCVVERLFFIVKGPASSDRLIMMAGQISTAEPVLDDMGFIGQVADLKIIEQARRILVLRISTKIQRALW